MNPANRISGRSCLIAATLFLFLFLPTVTVAQSSGFVETFEEQTPLVPPTSDEYTFTAAGSINALVVSTQAHPPSSKSLKLAPSGASTAGASFDFEPIHGDDIFCDSAEILWAYLTALPPVGTTTHIMVAQDTTTAVTVSSRLEVRIADSGAITAYFENSGGVETIKSTGTVMPINTWVDFLFSSNTANCGTSGTVIASEALGFAQTNTMSMVGLNSLNIIFLGDQSSAAPILYLDDFEVTSVGGAESIGTADATVATTTLTDMTILENGGGVIARTNAGDFIRTYSGESLVAGYSEDTNCAGGKGIAALGDDGYAYFTCGGTTPTSLKLISVNGDVYPFNCDNSPDETACLAHDGTISLSALSDEANFVSLHPVIDGEITHQRTTVPSHTGQLHEFVFAVGETTGTITALDVGFWETNGAQNGDEAAMDRTTYGSNAIQELCGVGALTGIYASQPAQQTKGYQISIDGTPFEIDDPTDTITGVNLNPDITPNGYTGATSVNNAEDISCGTNRILVSRPSGSGLVSLVNPANGSTVWSVAGVYSDVAISRDDKWAALSTATETFFVNALNGTVLCSMTNPAGSIVQTKLDALGQRFYLATASLIAYKAVHTCTTGTAISPGGGGSATSTATSSSTLTGPAQNTGNPLGDMVNLVNVAWGFDWSWIIGAIILSIILIPIAIATAGNALVCSVIIVLCTVANIKLGLWPEWTVLVMVFLIIAFASNRLFSKERGADAA